MKILHINLERGWRGGEQQTLYLMDGLRSLGHESALLARWNRDLVSRVRAAGFPVIVISKPFVLHGRHVQGHDIIHAHETRGLQIASLWKRVYGKPLIYTRRVDNPPGSHLFNRWKFGQVDRLVAISRKVSDVMARWGYDPDRIRVIHSSVPCTNDLDREALDALKTRFRYRKVVGCVASLEKRKDHATLLRAAKIVQEEMPDVVFVLVGDGDMRAGLEKQASALGLENVVFEGYRADPFPYYGVFDVFVMPSREEGLCSSILDAFRYWVPVVATDAGGIPELVTHGETGLLARVGDDPGIAACIMRMLGDSGLRQGCTRRAHAFLMKGFTLENMAGAYERVYLEASGGHQAED
jgi:glycosyltransferase involved in cell wall biosynthesis